MMDAIRNAQLAAIRTLLRDRPIAQPGASFTEMRRGLDALGDLSPPLPGVTATAVDAGGVAATWFTASGGDSSRIVLYLHGGGYVMGSVRSHRPLLERLALAVEGRVLALDYRLAPEAPFPAAVEDACAAWHWLLASGAAAERIAVAGDSAGGGLAVALLVALRDARVALPACAVPISPWTDMTASGASMQTRAARDPMVQRAALLAIAATYLDGAAPETPLASPLNAELDGLPPFLIQVGDAETLLDDSTRLAARLEAAGVDVTLEVWDDMIHVWHLFAPILDAGQQAIARIGDFVRTHAG